MQVRKVIVREGAGIILHPPRRGVQVQATGRSVAVYNSVTLEEYKNA